MRRNRKIFGSRIKRQRRSNGIQRKSTISSTVSAEPDTISSVESEKSNAGAKTKYTEDFPLLGQGFAREGLNDEEISRKLGISKTTFYEYLKKFPEFSESIKEGKAPVDIKVENAMLKHSLGYEYEEVSVEYDSAKKEGDKPVVRKVKKTTKEIAPHFGSGAFWMTNRMPKKWKNRYKVDATVQVKPLSMEDLLKSEAAE